MARLRTLKPSFFTNDILAEVEPLGRILFQGLWCIADREGRLEDRPRRIKAEVLPYDDADADQLLNDLAEREFIIRYEVEGKRYIQIVNFTKHQSPHYKELPSAIPAPPGWEDSGYVVGGLPEADRQRILKRDDFTCRRCGSTEDLTIDHKIPRSRGGTNDEDNLQTLCRRCNSAKNNRQAAAFNKESLANDQPIIGQSSAKPSAPLASVVGSSSGNQLLGTSSGNHLRAPARAGGADAAESLVHILCEESGFDISEMTRKERKEQRGHATGILSEGFSEDDVRGCLRYLLSQPWRDSKPDLLTVHRKIGQWKREGCPAVASSRASPAGNGRHGLTAAELAERAMRHAERNA